jgi:mannosyltransferase OCH1-like enzyme
MIPKILHQTWKSRDDFPYNFSEWSKSFKSTNPELPRTVYDDKDNRELIRRHIPNLLGLYDEFPREIFRADFVRPIYLFFQGGLYADLDFQCLRRLDSIFSPPELNLLLGRMGTDQTFAHSIPNAFMASSAHECFWLGYLAAMEAAWNTRKHQENIISQPEQITGPVVLREVVNLYTS